MSYDHAWERRRASWAADEPTIDATVNLGLMSALPTRSLARVNVTDVGNSGSDGNALLTPLIRIGAIFAGRKEGGIL